MKRFLVKIALLGVVAIAVYVVEYLVGSFVFGAQYGESYDAAITDKIARLESLKGPKIILVGNSNVAFGIDSPLLERELGMPVANMGLHGDLGNRFHERMLHGRVSAGDYIVIMHTEYDRDGCIIDPSLGWVAVENHAKLYPLVPPQSIIEMLRTYPNYFATCFKLIRKGKRYEAPPVYNRGVFNAWGDVACPRQEAAYRFKPQDAKLPVDIDPGYREWFNDFCKEMRGRGAHVLISSLPLHTGEFAQKEEDIRALQANLESQLDAEVISDFMDYRFSPSEFFDMKFHLNDAGTSKRTLQLISDIKRWRAKHNITVPACAGE